MFKLLATVQKGSSRFFHFYTIDDSFDLYCTVDDDKEPALDKNIMEYYPKEKWIVLKDFMKARAGIKNIKGKNTKLRGRMILGIRIEDYILNRIFWNHHFNIKDSEYTYDNYLNYKRLIQNKRGYLVRVCQFCNEAIVVATTRGTKILHYNTFLTVKNALARKPRQSHPLIYHLTDRYYFIAMRSEGARKFVCYRCLTGKYYRSSSLYDMERYGWKATNR